MTWKDLPAKDNTASIKALEKALTEATQSLAARRVVKIEPLYVAKPTKRRKDDWTRVIIPDSHGAHIARHAAAAFLADLKRLDPDEIVMLGDHLDCGGFLAQHQTMGFIAETNTSYEADLEATNSFLDLIISNAPRARIHYIQGNHEARVEKWCVTASLRHSRDAKGLLDVFGPEARLKLKERGISYYLTNGRYHGLPVPGTIKLGRCAFTHGISFGRHATHDHAVRFGLSVVHGHTHRSQSAIIRTVGGGVVGAWCPGCLCQLQPLYMATSPSDWSHGIGIQVVAKSGRFMHINCPIIDGQSLLFNLNLKEHHV